MALVNVNADPQPGDAGYYDWHDNVAAANNKLKAALDAAANGDLIGADANNEPKAIPSGTFTKLRGAAEVITVSGTSSGDHSNLREALAAASKLHTAFAHEGIQVDVKLLSGFVLDQQNAVERVDLSPIQLVAEDATVTIDRSALTTAYDGMFPAFYADDGAALPLIAVLFDMDASGTGTDRHGVALRGGSAVRFAASAGIQNVGGRGADVAEDSFLYARSGDFSGAGEHGVRISNGASGYLRSATIQNCGQINLAVSSGSANAVDSSLTGAGTDGLSANGTARVSAFRAVADSAGRYGVLADDGGHVVFRDGSAINCATDGVRAGPDGHVDADGATAGGTVRDFASAGGGTISTIGATGTINTVEDKGGDATPVLKRQMAGSISRVQHRSARHYTAEGLAIAATVATFDGREHYAPILFDRDSTIDLVGLEVTTAGAGGTSIHLGLRNNADDGSPGSLVQDFGTIPGDSTGTHTLTVTQATQRWKRYHLVALPVGGAPTVAAIRLPVFAYGANTVANIADMKTGLVSNSGLSSLASTAPTAATSVLDSPRLFYRVS